MIERKDAAPEPVAYGICSLSDGGLGAEIAPVAWSTFPQRMEKLRADKWVIAGRAEIVPLYAAPPQDSLEHKRREDVRKLCYILEGDVNSAKTMIDAEKLAGNVVKEAHAAGESVGLRVALHYLIEIFPDAFKDSDNG